MIKVPFSNLSGSHDPIRQELDSAIKAVIDHNSFISGPQVQLFEEAFANYHQAKYAIGCSSGTSALHLALLTCGVKAGDEVILPSHTFIATAEAVSHLGATPVFVDIDEKTFNIDPKNIEQAITDKTAAIIAVHLYGQCANMPAISAIAKKHGLKLIEDAAQAHGATYDEKFVGSWGDVACFSFYPGKNLGAFGDAGALITNDEGTAENVRLLLDHGRESKYTHLCIGYNYRLDSLQAAILSVKLKYLSRWTEQRREIAEQYNQLLKDAEVITPDVDPLAKHVYHLYVIKIKDRDRWCEYLKTRGVIAGIHYPTPLHLQPAYQFLNYKAGDFPVTERVAHEILSLPIFPGQTPEQVRCVADIIRAGIFTESPA
ncbi:MAG: erythromycin biosynthesis sensory transduction protein eryC1 [Legionellaceae bacterium]|nr:erythromycin biosynthesis sensory transduction protein eryC1 [Legionellaceae bacterium]